MPRTPEVQGPTIRSEALEPARNISSDATSAQTTSNEVPPVNPNQDATLIVNSTPTEEPPEDKTELEVLCIVVDV